MVLIKIANKHLYSQNGAVNLVRICCGIESKPLVSILLDKSGAGIEPRLGNPSGSENGKIDGNIILSG